MKTATNFSGMLSLLIAFSCTKTSSDLSSQVFSSNQELFDAIGEHSQVPAPPREPGADAWVQLGKSLYSDPNWSRSKRSCESCHGKPERGFTDPKTQLYNSSYLYQFGHIGQYGSILDAIAHMILNPVLMDTDFAELKNRLSTAPNEPQLNTLSQGTKGLFTIQQQPIPARLIAKAYASLKDQSLKTAFNKMLTNHNLLTEETMKAILSPTVPSNIEKQGSDHEDTNALSVTMASYALSVYLLSLESYHSPFDKFAEKALLTLDINSAFHPQFSREEWQGFLVFRKHSCHHCHSGPNFSRGLVYNVGGSIPSEKGMENLDTKPLKLLLDVMGHAASPLYPQYVDFSCRDESWKKLAKTLLHHSCDVSSYPIQDTDAIGAIKTRSLRNLMVVDPDKYHKDAHVLVGTLSSLLNFDELDIKEEETLGKFLTSLRSESH